MYAWNQKVSWVHVTNDGALTKERKSVMISYGLTPSLPTIPSANTEPGIQVPARSTSTPITGAVSSPSLNCNLCLETPSATGVEEIKRRLREVRNRGSGIRIGQITRISRSDQLPFLPVPSIINPRDILVDLLTMKKRMMVTILLASIDRFAPGTSCPSEAVALRERALHRSADRCPDDRLATCSHR